MVVQGLPACFSHISVCHPLSAIRFISIYSVPGTVRGTVHFLNLKQLDLLTWRCVTGLSRGKLLPRLSVVLSSSRGGKKVEWTGPLWVGPRSLPLLWRATPLHLVLQLGWAAPLVSPPGPPRTAPLSAGGTSALTITGGSVHLLVMVWRNVIFCAYISVKIWILRSDWLITGWA